MIYFRIFCDNSLCQANINIWFSTFHKANTKPTEVSGHQACLKKMVAKNYLLKFFLKIVLMSSKMWDYILFSDSVVLIFLILYHLIKFTRHCYLPLPAFAPAEVINRGPLGYKNVKMARLKHHFLRKQRNSRMYQGLFWQMLSSRGNL